MDLLYIRALHIIFVLSWFAGLFYIVRLFIYHVEANDKNEEAKQVLQAQFKIMQYRLWYIITWPAAILATIFGYYMVINNTAYYLESAWMLSKIGLTTLLWIYHIMTHLVFRKIQQGKSTLTSIQLSLWNELATLFMVSIVFIVVLKNALNWIYGTIGFFAVGVALMIAVRLYKRYRS